MSSQLTHERCSELLADYLARELDPEQHRLVEHHLEYCAQCSAERAGLGTLRSESERLTTDERVALRAAVLGATTAAEPAGHRLEDESDPVVVPLGGRGSRAGKYLGIAAMLAVLAVGSLFVFRGGGLTGSDDDSGAVGVAEGSGQSAEEDATAGLAEDEPSPGRRAAKDLILTFQSDRGVIAEEDLDKLGRRAGAVLVSSTQALDSSEEVRDEELRFNRAPENLLGRLAARAPEALAPDVTECGRTALDELDEPGLSTYATTATLEGEDVIVLGFVTGARPPDRYAVFAFPRGDCTTILASAEGPLE
jgi:Putative zinc-finger